MSSCEESEKVGGSFPTLINSVDRQEKKREKEKRKRRKKKTVRGKKRKREREKDKIFPMFRRSELDNPRTKVGPAMRATRGYRNPNFSSKLQEVGVFSYIGFLFT